MGLDDMDTTRTCEIVLVAPPKGIGFCLQKGRNELVDYDLSDGSDIIVRFEVRVKQQKDGSPNFLGSFTQGKPSKRFVHVCIGRWAGQSGTFINGRAKIPLSGIGWTMIELVRQADNGVLVTRYEARGRSGAPATATVPSKRPILIPSWHRLPLRSCCDWKVNLLLSFVLGDRASNLARRHQRIALAASVGLQTDFKTEAEALSGRTRKCVMQTQPQAASVRSRPSVLEARPPRRRMVLEQQSRAG